MWLRLQGTAKRFGERTLFEGVDLQVGPGDRIGLVGPNGAGKTSLLRIASGDDTPDAGERHLSRGARVGLLRQEVDPGGTRTVREEAGTALAELSSLESELRSLEAQMAEAGDEGIPAALAERYDHVHDRFQREGGFEREARIERVLAGLGFDERGRGRPLSALSGGWLMRVELAKLLLADPDVLLLDEPTNHLDLPSIQWFEETLMQFRGGVIVISHDRTFLRRHVKRVCELSAGRFSTYEGGYDRYLSEREARHEELVARKRSQDQKIAQAEKFIDRFRAKATKARQVQSRVKALDKIDRIEIDTPQTRTMRLRIPPAERAGAVPIRLEAVEKAYGDTVVYEGIDFEVRRGECVALAGPNGAGKSTLLRILAGVLDFDAGERTLGHNCQVAFYAQHQLEALEAGRTVLEEIEQVASTSDVPRLRGHLGAFMFSGDDVEKKVSVLSGGEKARLALAKMLLRPANILVLDEPTNHLDVEGCEVLERALADYNGTLVFISHDRAFINALATRVVEVKAGALRDFIGNFDDYQRRLEEPPAGTPTELAAPAFAPEPRATSPAPSKAERARAREQRKSRDRIQRRIERLEAEILERETAREELGWRFGDPEVARDAGALQRIEAERSGISEAIDGLYREWERLAAELEALGDADDLPAVG